MWVQDKSIVALNTDKDKYLNYETSNNGDLIGSVHVHCHKSEELNSFGVPRKFIHHSDGYTRVKFPKRMIGLKENAIIRLLVDDEGQLLAYGAGNKLPNYKSYRHLSGISIQK